MLIDIIALILLVLAVFKGFTKGFVVAVFSFLAFIIGLAAAMKLSVVVAGYLGDNTSLSQRWLPFLAFAIVFIGVVLLVRLGAKAIEGALRLAMLGWANRLGGIIFYALLYLFIYSVLLFFVQKINLFKPETIEASVSYGWIAPFGPKVLEGIGVVLPFFQDMFTELSDFFEGVSQKAS